jgi:hypothetical protein
MVLYHNNIIFYESNEYDMVMESEEYYCIES